MRCRDIVATENIESLPENATVADAARLMSETGVGFLPVCDADSKVLGVVTDRDLVVNAMARGLDPAATPVTSVMSHPAVTCFIDGDLGMAEDLMAEEQKSRIVLVDGDGRVAGVLSIADIVERAPKREALRTLQAVLWREALGPRAGAPRDQPPFLTPEAHPPHGRADETVFTGGKHDDGYTEFP
ncbi:MAG TPA: CBS domain-containing protein [Polyangia bacterium]|nr:CBS domain-containing protein [Polyangia bacterium]HVY37633.1 CBS domain-containing protein [Polyangia bacterium]